MIVWVTTTSQPSNRSGFSEDASPQLPATFVPGRLEQQRAVVRVEAEHRGQRVVVDLDELDGVLALVRMLGDDDGDRLADKRTLSVARSRWVISTFISPAADGGMTGSSARSAPVKAATTPGAASAALTSMLLMRACATGRPDEEDVVGAVEAVVHHVLGVDAAGGQEFRILCPQDPRTQDAQLTISSSRPPCARLTVSHTSRTRQYHPIFLREPVRGRRMRHRTARHE